MQLITVKMRSDINDKNIMFLCCFNTLYKQFLFISFDRKFCYLRNKPFRRNNLNSEKVFRINKKYNIYDIVGTANGLLYELF